MDFEYEDDVEENDIEYFAELIKAYPFTDDEIRDVFRHLMASEKPILPHDMFAFEIRESDIRDARVTRLCKSMSNHIFRIQFFNGLRFVIRLSSEHSYKEEIAIINDVAGTGVEVPRSYFSDPEGIEIGQRSYYAMLQEHVDGRDFEYAAKHNLITTGDKEVLLEEMGKRLKLIHSITEINGQSQENLHEGFYAEAMDLLDHERNTILDQGICVLEEFEEIYGKLDSLRDAAEIFGKQSFGLAHMDFHPKHVILNLEAARPSIRAIIDWGDATFTNTFFDFSLWDYWCGEDFLVDSLMSAYGMEVFTSAESKLNVELTTIAALIKEVCSYAHLRDYRATQLGLWQRLKFETIAATY